MTLTEDRGSSAVYHVYRKKTHLIITNTINVKKERRSIKKQHKKQAEELPRGVAAPEDYGFFVHQPYLSFHHPPRTLRLGTDKKGPVFCLIKNSWLWKRWVLQFSDRLTEDGVVDPRGVISWTHNSADQKDLSFKGYKVRTWRAWGESGKSYHRSVNSERKLNPKGNDGQSNPNNATGGTPLHADEVVYLDWASPFSKNTRRYHFQYAGIDFVWKGTGTVKETGRCGFWLRYNNLKLVARIPMTDELNQGPAFMELCFAKYASSIHPEKAGVLEMYDQALERFAEQCIPHYVQPSTGNPKKETAFPSSHLHQTRLYHVVMATAICMVIGEAQKRETLRKILEIAASEGAGSSG